MKKISYWAKSHVIPSRILIIYFWITLNILGVYIGNLIHQLSFTIPTYIFNGCLCMFVILFVAYPQKNASVFYKGFGFYFNRKIFDFSLGLVTFILIVYTGTQWKNLNVNSKNASASSIIHLPKDSVINKNLLIKNFINSIKAEDVSKMNYAYKKAIIIKQIKAVNQAKDLSKNQKTFLIILSVLIALFLLFGVAVLSCNLSCSGMEGLAFLVGFGGATLIILLLNFVLKKINRKKDDSKIK